MAEIEIETEIKTEIEIATETAARQTDTTGELPAHLRDIDLIPLL